MFIVRGIVGSFVLTWGGDAWKLDRGDAKPFVNAADAAEFIDDQSKPAARYRFSHLWLERE